MQKEEVMISGPSDWPVPAVNSEFIVTAKNNKILWEKMKHFLFLNTEYETCADSLHWVKNVKLLFLVVFVIKGACKIRILSKSH